MEEANTEYTILASADHWGPQGKPDQGGAPKTLYTKTELNNLVQKQVLGCFETIQDTTVNGKNKQVFQTKQKEDKQQ